ncbi:hypothetical protein SAMN00017477_1346 [Peptoniphilus asaccharolyticus DSM 20463]|uniref:Uncharacterized protein n=1 Tax=Peptoniphilus asaccharolyticus DSM 20463 TaxID=573058 RepID=A0A1W1V472_PEPAS|nr:hypothetical protein [Peptoniphilus asaccharolyticus]MBL7576293.1 hypothetical protein [Peptoniphilus asaccharolyticus]SMB88128.1 hypothetical protein SAMN00017477_1346 [Peptoniphilus asaccharolyticus DSM 20463]
MENKPLNKDNIIREVVKIFVGGVLALIVKVSSPIIITFVMTIANKILFNKHDAVSGATRYSNLIEKLTISLSFVSGIIIILILIYILVHLYRLYREVK